MICVNDNNLRMYIYLYLSTISSILPTLRLLWSNLWQQIQKEQVCILKVSRFIVVTVGFVVVAVVRVHICYYV